VKRLLTFKDFGCESHSRVKVKHASVREVAVYSPPMGSTQRGNVLTLTNPVFPNGTGSISWVDFPANTVFVAGERQA